jgi:hypothetical protein
VPEAERQGSVIEFVASHSDDYKFTDVTAAKGPNRGANDLKKSAREWQLGKRCE